MIALPMLIIWVIGLPIAMFMVLKLHTKDQHNDEMRFRFGMLMEGYEDEYFYWESVIASRKALVMMISVFMATLSVDIQAYVGIAVVMAYMSLHIMWRPYNHKLLDQMETLALVTSFITLYAGIFMYILNRNVRDAEKSGGSSGANSEGSSVLGLFITIVIVVVNIMYAAYAIWEIAYQTLLHAEGCLKRVVLCLHKCCRPCRSAEAAALHALRHDKNANKKRKITPKVAPKVAPSEQILSSPSLPNEKKPKAAEAAEAAGLREWKAPSDSEDSVAEVSEHEHEQGARKQSAPKFPI
jgi:hypothetical protein